MRLVLCSGSPRRREMLSRVGLRFDVEIPRVAETRESGEHIDAYPERLARDKASAGLLSWRKRGGVGPAVALAADTIVVLGEEVLEKPRDRADARRMLRMLSGTEHRVITGVCVATDGEKRSRSVVTGVRFTDLSEAALRWLVDSGDGDDKAGAYAIQGLAGAFVERIDGSFSNVVGLPLTETLQLLAGAGLRMPWG
ncbi:MAG TPA: Maf family protein [Myxococcales bacterium]|jgi:septum formation protein|nr:Maf family protein [Myxococcales bacterium]